VYADDVVPLRESPVAIGGGKSQARPTLDSLRKSVLKLRDSLLPSNKKKSRTSPGDDRHYPTRRYDYRGIIVESVSGSDRWVSTGDCSMSDSGNLATKAWKTRKARDAGDEEKKGIFYGVELGQQEWKESRNQSSKRIRRSFFADSYYNNQRNVSENEAHRRALITEGALGNVMKTPEAEGIVAKSRSNEGSLASALNETNLFEPHKESLLIRDRFINLTFVPSADGRMNVSGTRYSSSVESRPNVNASLRRIDSDPRARLLKRIADDGIPATSSIVGQSSSGTRRAADRATMDRANSANPDESLARSTSADPIRFSQDDDVSDGGARGRSEDRSDVEKLRAVTRKIPRLGANDEQSLREGAAGFPRGNSPRAFDSLANESRCCVLGAAAASAAGEGRKGPVAVVIKMLEKPGTGAVMRLSLMGKNGTRGMKMPAAMTREDSARPIADDSRQQQMVLAPLSGNGRANKSNGNSANGGIDIRGLGSNGNETMNVKETVRPCEHGNNLRRKLLWISKASADADAEGSSMESARLTPNVTSERYAGDIVDDDRKGNKIKLKCDDAASPKSRNSEANRRARQKRSEYLSDDLAGPKSAVVEKEATSSRVEKRENDEEYLNQSAEGLKRYNDRAEFDGMEGRTLTRVKSVRN